MLKHIVSWKLRPDLLDAESHYQSIKQGLEALNGRIAGLLRIEVGRNVLPDEQAADLVLYSEFIDLAALQCYQQHPEHEAIKPLCERPVMSGA